MCIIPCTIKKLERKRKNSYQCITGAIVSFGAGVYYILDWYYKSKTEILTDIHLNHKTFHMSIQSA